MRRAPSAPNNWAAKLARLAGIRTEGLHPLPRDVGTSSQARDTDHSDDPMASIILVHPPAQDGMQPPANPDSLVLDVCIVLWNLFRSLLTSTASMAPSASHTRRTCFQAHTGARGCPATAHQRQQHEEHGTSANHHK